MLTLASHHRCLPSVKQKVSMNRKLSNDAHPPELLCWYLRNSRLTRSTSNAEKVMPSSSQCRVHSMGLKVKSRCIARTLSHCIQYASLLTHVFRLINCRNKLLQHPSTRKPVGANLRCPSLQCELSLLVPLNCSALKTLGHGTNKTL